VVMRCPRSSEYSESAPSPVRTAQRLGAHLPQGALVAAPRGPGVLYGADQVVVGQQVEDGVEFLDRLEAPAVELVDVAARDLGRGGALTVLTVLTTQVLLDGLPDGAGSLGPLVGAHQGQGRLGVREQVVTPKADGGLHRGSADGAAPAPPL